MEIAQKRRTFWIMKTGLLAVLAAFALVATGFSGGWRGGGGGWHGGGGWRGGGFRGGYYGRGYYGGRRYWNAGYYRWNGGWRWWGGGYNPWWIFGSMGLPVLRLLQTRYGLGMDRVTATDTDTESGNVQPKCGGGKNLTGERNG